MKRIVVLLLFILYGCTHSVDVIEKALNLKFARGAGRYGFVDTVVLRWQRGEDIKGYEIRIDTTPDFKTKIQEGFTRDTFYIFYPIRGKALTYYAEFRPILDKSDDLPFVDSISFKIDTSLPRLIYPGVSDTFLVGERIFFRWKSDYAIKKIIIEIATVSVSKKRVRRKMGLIHLPGLKPKSYKGDTVIIYEDTISDADSLSFIIPPYPLLMWRVKVVNDFESKWTPWSRFYVQVKVPSLIYPRDSEDVDRSGFVESVKFIFHPVPAEKPVIYSLYISQFPDGYEYLDSVITTDTMVTWPVRKGGVLYWKVCTEGGCSGVRSFILDGGKSYLVSPDTFINGFSTYVNFQWRDIPGAHSYRLRVGYDPGFSFALVDTFLSSSSFRWVVNASLDDIYAQVKPIGVKYEGQWSEVKHIIPTGVAPIVIKPRENEEFLYPDTIQVIYSSIQGASEYTLRVLDSNLNVVNEIQSQDTEISLSILHMRGKYYVKVRGETPYFKGPYSAPSGFYILNPAPVPIFPFGNLIWNACYVYISWHSIQKRDVEYQLQVALDPFFSATIVDTLLTDTVLSFSVPDTGVFYWRVRGRLAEDVFTDWSGIKKFKIIAPIEVIYRPFQNDTIEAGDTLKISVRSFENAYEYQAIACLDMECSEVEYNTTSSDTLLILTLNTTGIRYLRAKARFGCFDTRWSMPVKIFVVTRKED